MKQRFLHGATMIGAGLLAFASAEAVASAAACPTTNVVYVAGSSAVKPFLAALATKLTGSLTILYKSQGSCVGVTDMTTPVALTGTASQWDGAGAETSCDLPGDKNADVGVSDVFATSCSGVTTVPADLGDFYGPNQIMNFVVPAGSSETVISADAAFLVYGLGIAGGVSPWTVDENLLLRRNEGSGTQSMISAALSVNNPVILPPNKWKGKDAGGSGALLTAVAGSSNPNATIGILASDLADGARDKVKILAYQHTQQLTGYWPDSKPTLFDKINVRDGHYPIWGPLHFYAKKDSSGNPVIDGAKKLIGYFTGKEPVPTGVNLLDIESKSGHTVPQCAMYVTRSTELGDYSDYKPEQPCYCAFEKSATGATSCKSCAMDSECDAATQKCSNGYCEAK
jgi:ABC-type phosphate transport system substrate-binding protein